MGCGLLSRPSITLDTKLFVHVVEARFAYEMLLFQQRQQLHRSVAQWYERSYAANLAPHYPFLAHHWQHAGEPSKAIDYLEKAGEQSLRSGGYNEAAEFFSEAIGLDAERQPGDRFISAGPVATAAWRGPAGTGKALAKSAPPATGAAATGPLDARFAVGTVHQSARAHGPPVRAASRSLTGRGRKRRTLVLTPPTATNGSPRYTIYPCPRMDCWLWHTSAPATMTWPVEPRKKPCG